MSFRLEAKVRNCWKIERTIEEEDEGRDERRRRAIVSVQFGRVVRATPVVLVPDAMIAVSLYLYSVILSQQEIKQEEENKLIKN